MENIKRKYDYSKTFENVFEAFLFSKLDEIIEGYLNGSYNESIATTPHESEVHE